MEDGRVTGQALLVVPGTCTGGTTAHDLRSQGTLGVNLANHKKIKKIYILLETRVCHIYIIDTLCPAFVPFANFNRTFGDVVPKVESAYDIPVD